MSIAARIAMLLALVLAVLAAGWRVHTRADAAGYARAQAEHAADLLATSEAARQRKDELTHETQAIDRRHQAEKARLVDLARSNDERVRQLQAALADRAAGADPGPAGRADDAAWAIARECPGALAAVDGHAQSLSARLAALQSWAGRVCVSAAPED